MNTANFRADALRKLESAKRDLSEYTYGAKEMEYMMQECAADDFPTVDDMHDDDNDILRQLGHGLIVHDDWQPNF